MEHNLHDIKEVRETRDPEKVSQLLNECWVMNYISHEPNRSHVIMNFE